MAQDLQRARATNEACQYSPVLTRLPIAHRPGIRSPRLRKRNARACFDSSIFRHCWSKDYLQTCKHANSANSAKGMHPTSRTLPPAAESEARAKCAKCQCELGLRAPSPSPVLRAFGWCQGNLNFGIGSMSGGGWGQRGFMTDFAREQRGAAGRFRRPPISRCFKLGKRPGRLLARQDE